ncbi:diguanylate cyclase domain-containing protein [Faunimonas sp. B44]|uniref:diguanylate cyclase domain-containing protein n=1 Tax=Faunimonas sp. B44 TaxID=3461493 RepID=UPI0040440238
MSEEKDQARPEEGYEPDLTPVLAAASDDRRSQSGANSQTILTAIGEALYEWDLETDRQRWSANVGDVLGLERFDGLAVGESYKTLVDPDSLTDRHQAVLNAIGIDYGSGVPYEVTYGLRLPGGPGTRTVWVQDRGVWFADGTGRPALARGAIRTVSPAGDVVRQRPEGLPRRAAFLQQLDVLVAVARHYRTPFVFALAAIDNLRVAAELHGISATEEMESALAARARQVVRRGDLVGWLSDDELGLMLRVIDLDEAQQAMERILAGICDPIPLASGQTIQPRVAVGAVMAPSDADSVQHGLARARRAVRRARRLGPGRFVFHPQADGSHADAGAEEAPEGRDRARSAGAGSAG